MSLIVSARLKTKVVDGIEIMDVEVGKEYHVDLDSRRRMNWHNREQGRQRDLDCVWDVDNGGYLPLEVLELRLS